ncbi:MAG TPA: hypothetical protein VGO62_17580 [Myxococcota bacterium]
MLAVAAAGDDSAAVRSPAPLRYVIAIGYNGDVPAADDSHAHQVLQFADDDAARFFLEERPGAARAWLLTTFDNESARAFSAGGANESAVSVARPPTADELSRTLGEAFWQMRQDKDAGKSTELVLYFAGHGDVSEGGEGYVALAGSHLTRSMLETEVLIPSPATTNHLLIDACASAFMLPRGSAPAAGEALSPALFLKRTAAAQEAWSRTGAIVATSDAGAVHESSDIGGGLFSFALRSALVGAADVNGDGRVEYGEAAAFIAAQSALATDPRAQLHVTARAPAQTPHAPLADLSRAGASHYLVIDQPRTANLRVLDDRGAPYAEVHREGAAPPAILALFHSAFFVVQNGDEEAVLVPRRGGAYALSSLSWKKSAQARVSDGGVDALTRTAAVAFGPQFVGGFLSSAGVDGLVPPVDGGAIAIAFADGGAPELRIPWWTLAGTAGTGAGVLAAGAVFCAIGNSLALADLDRRFQRTGTLDPNLALTTDTWLAASLGLGAGAVVTGLAAGGLAFVATTEDK